MAVAIDTTIDTSLEGSPSTEMGSVIHFVLQGKGGVGKSYISSLMAQYHRSKELDPVCIDTDPVNSTLAGYGAFRAKRLDIMRGNDIDPRAFDALIEEIIPTKNETIIIDNGASSFVPLCSYMLDNGIIGLLESEGHEVLIHSIVTGGQGLQDTMNGLDSLLSNFGDGVKIVVWLNEYFGRIEKQGVKFEDTDFYQKHSDKFWAIVPLLQQNAATTGKDIESMVVDRLTFEEAIEDPAFSFMSKHRLRRVREEVFSAIERIGL